jgi:glycine betaine/proline transport system substrate-binding protein
MLKDFESVQKKNVVLAGIHDAKTREEWWYPLYVKEKCPGLPDYKALNRCAKLFAAPGSNGKGVYMGGPWEKPDALMAKGLGLDFIIKTAKDSDELSNYIKEAYRQKRPIVAFNWTPNWIEIEYKGEFVEFPAYSPECESDPSWGENKFFTHDCGNPKDALLFKGAWKKMEETWPCGYKILENMNLTNQMVAKAAYLVDVKKHSYDEAARLWMEEYKDTVKSWIPKKCSR